jgi:hypothetical protein
LLTVDSQIIQTSIPDYFEPCGISSFDCTDSIRGAGATVAAPAFDQNESFPPVPAISPLPTPGTLDSRDQGAKGREFFFAPDLINRLAEGPHDVEAIQIIQRLWGLLGDNLEIRCSHVAAHELELAATLFAEQ